MFNCLSAKLSTTSEGVKGSGGISPRMRNISTISGRILFGPQQLYCLSGNDSLEETVDAGVGLGHVCNKFVFNAI